jgi:two-component system, chemotaxis family, chemotaxis protein CheY
MARILITDDEKQVRDLLGALLRAEGHEVREACDGTQAVRACCAEPFDLVLCDLFMPHREGLETIRELRQWLPGLRIVAMSGLAGAGDLLRVAQVMGADAALQKPFSRQELLAAIGEALAGAPGR